MSSLCIHLEQKDIKRYKKMFLFTYINAIFWLHIKLKIASEGIGNKEPVNLYLAIVLTIRILYDLYH
jgi:hypothetical protein